MLRWHPHKPMANITQLCHPGSCLLPVWEPMVSFCLQCSEWDGCKNKTKAAVATAITKKKKKWSVVELGRWRRESPWWPLGS